MTIRLALLAALLATAACSSAPPAPADEKKVELVPTVKVQTGEVLHEKMPKYLTLTGSVLADVSSDVAANVSGRVTRTYVERGQKVKKGDILAMVDSRAAGFQAAAATAQSKAAEVQVNQAQQDCARADTLFAQGALPKAEYERQKTQCTSSLYSANAAQAQADLAGKLAGDTTIRAPIDGIVGERSISTGEFVQPPTRVASIFFIDQVRVNISVPEAVIGQVQVGQTLEVRVSAYPDDVFPAVVRFVSPALRATTRDLIIEAVAPNGGHKLHPGMFATVLLLTGEEEQPTVPADAIKRDGTVRRLFVAKESAAQEWIVQTGVEKNGRIAVLEALPSGTRVVIKPPPGLRDGSPIQSVQ